MRFDISQCQKSIPSCFRIKQLSRRTNCLLQTNHLNLFQEFHQRLNDFPECPALFLTILIQKHQPKEKVRINKRCLRGGISPPEINIHHTSSHCDLFFRFRKISDSFFWEHQFFN
ncbi:hypothetical protein CEXT_89581 [Caerostris extrusa]|uniref:Uncharacterized protein n=1 Tax=Caerostris extrusa TaxID=172846 RepID=A0AAV4YDK3_CAEEX|nr:hypothetical protein CEXT_89581 [Caerostris extrusa]